MNAQAQSSEGDKQRAEYHRNNATALTAAATAIQAGLLAALAALVTSLESTAAILGILGVVVAVALLTYSFYAGGRGNAAVGVRLAAGTELKDQYDDGWYNTQAATGLLGFVVGVASLGLVAAFGIKNKDESLQLINQSIGEVKGRIDGMERTLELGQGAIADLRTKTVVVEGELRSSREAMAEEKTEAAHALSQVAAQINALREASDRLERSLEDVRRSLVAPEDHELLTPPEGHQSR